MPCCSCCYCRCCCCKCCCSKKKPEEAPSLADTEDIQLALAYISKDDDGGGDSLLRESSSILNYNGTGTIAPTPSMPITCNIAVYEDYDISFNNLLLEAEAAIEKEILPERIDQGSSGSYFVSNTKREHIGVFKPKDEEPYGSMNPKWAKWFQRKCCCCCFGRGCLVPNSGYLSEAGAYMVDLKFCLNVVPRTKVIRMASTTFHYGKIRRETARAKKTLADKFPAVGKRFNRIGLPLKMGSFQWFVNGYKDAIEWIEYFEESQLPPSDKYEFQLEFERLVILDYIIRNTDRGNDNWLIKYNARDVDRGIPVDGFAPSASTEGDRRVIKIAAIDNGLAFPFKHPNEWRTYPFRWARLPMAKIPFSTDTRDKFLPMFTNITFIEELCSDLYYLFSLAKHFQRTIFEKQMAVMRGQILNLANALRDLKSPFQLTQMTPVVIMRKTSYPSASPRHQATSIHEVTSSLKLENVMRISPSNTLVFDSEEYKTQVSHENPLFSAW